MPASLKRIGTGRGRDAAARLAALDRSQAVITFDLDGTILDANENFLRTMGYRLDEVRGKHHRMFVDPAERSSDEYREFWDSLREGRYRQDLFKRFGKGGTEIWIEASYNPILDGDGRPYKVVKYATDVTDRQMQLAELRGLTQAISRVQAVISFDLDGTILDSEPELPRRDRLHDRRDPRPAPQHVRRPRPSAQPRVRPVLAHVGERSVPVGPLSTHRQGRQGGVDRGVVQPDLRRATATCTGS